MVPANSTGVVIRRVSENLGTIEEHDYTFTIVLGVKGDHLILELTEREGHPRPRVHDVIFAWLSAYRKAVSSQCFCDPPFVGALIAAVRLSSALEIVSTSADTSFLVAVCQEHADSAK
jgi:hypothetical protein